jgi:glycosyltransferase involved in cell wall biosynthesis
VSLVLSLKVSVRRRVDVVHVHNPPDTFFVIGAVHKLLGRRFVYDHHDLTPEMYDALFAGRKRRIVHRALRTFEKLSCRLADRIIATNESYKRIEVERDGVPPDRVTVVRNGPDLERFRFTPGDESARDGKAHWTILWVGDMGYHDGVDYLLRAVRFLVFDIGRRDVRCVLVGDGDAFAQMTALAHVLELTPYVDFTGLVAYDDVPRYVAAADICACPDPQNTYNDHSTMIKIMEYMALAKPIVAFDLPENRVSAGDAALYAPPNDEIAFAEAMADLIDNPRRAAEMGLCGRRRIESELAWEHSAPNLLHAYEGL